MKRKLTIFFLALTFLYANNVYSGFHFGITSAAKGKVEEVKEKKEEAAKVFNQSPAISSLTANPTLVLPSSTSTITCTASDSDGDTLTYSWTATGGTIIGSGSSVTWTAPASEGTYTITCTVDDGKGGTAQKSVNVSVSTTNQAPVISSLTANPTSVSPSGDSTITCTASDPDGDTLTYSWSKTGGTISGSGSQVTWTAPSSEGTYTITCTADDGNGGTDQESVSITVSAADLTHQLPDTGQTTSYTDTFGEDHDYQPSATQMSYTDNGDGTITDNKTGLMWLKEGNYPFNGATSTGTWEQALTYCEGLSYAGYSDWRLPNRRELFSIVKFEGAAPLINTTYFLNTQGCYWTSTTFVPGTSAAVFVAFGGGYVVADGKTNACYVRPVRGGP